MNTSCHHCKKDLPVAIDGGRARVAFRETCPACGSDLHVCLNCKHYDAGSHHECRESSAEWVRDKERANTCEYFAPAPPGRAEGTSAKDTLSALDALFKRG